MVVRKAAARFDDLAQGAVQRLNRVGGVDHFVDVGRDGIRWYDMLPGPTPGLANRRIAFALLGLELLETNERHVSVHAGLYDGLRELRGDRLRKPLKPSTTAIRMSLTPRAFSSLTTLSQNLAPCTCSIQRPSTLFSSGKTGLDRVDLLVSNALRVKIPDEGKNKPVVCCGRAQFRWPLPGSSTASVTRLIRSGESSVP